MIKSVKCCEGGNGITKDGGKKEQACIKDKKSKRTSKQKDKNLSKDKTKFPQHTPKTGAIKIKQQQRNKTGPVPWKKETK